jgi:hypothetical protein
VLLRLRLRNREENGSLLRDQGGLLYKAPLTATVFKDFSSCYQHFTSRSFNSSIPDPSIPFVYVDSDGVKLLTDVVDEKDKLSEGIFALSMAEDGLMEMLALNEAS